jgi:threonine dehydrogenase-like Zn-dependent dehydrogenase
LIRRAVELLEANTIEPEALITQRMGLGGVREALELMANGMALKVLIEP